MNFMNPFALLLFATVGAAANPQHEVLRSHLPFIFQASYRMADAILPGQLYLGNEAAAADSTFLKEHRIQAIVAMSMEHANPSQAAVALGVPYAHFGLWDSAFPRDNGGEAALVAILHRAADHIHHLVEAGQGPVLVHCQVGMSRSTTGLIAYLLKYKRAEFPTYAAAIAHVQQARPIAAPNVRFARVLADFFESNSGEKELYFGEGAETLGEALRFTSSNVIARRVKNAPHGCSRSYSGSR